MQIHFAFVPTVLVVILTIHSNVIDEENTQPEDDSKTSLKQRSAQPPLLPPSAYQPPPQPASGCIFRASIPSSKDNDNSITKALTQVMQHPRHVRHETPPGSNVHGLGLTAAQTPPNAGTGSQSRNYDMPSLPHLRVQQLSPVGVIRRKELPEDASLMPARSSSLKNRKSRKPRPASFNSTIQSLGDYEEQSHADDLDFVPRNLDL